MSRSSPFSVPLARSQRRPAVPLLERLEDRTLLDGSSFYWADGNRIDLNPLPGEFVVKLTDPLADPTLLTASGAALEGFQIGDPVTKGVYRITAPSGLDNSPVDDPGALTGDGIAWVSRAFAGSSGPNAPVLVLDEAVVALQPGVTPTDVFGPTVNYRPLRGTPDQFVVTLDTGGQAVLDFANSFTSDPLVAWAAPNLFGHMQRYFTPNDPLYPNQWHLNNTGSNSGISGAIAGADVKAPAAWDISRGAGVTIAVLDDGIQLNHPDLMENIFVNDAEANGSPGVDDDGNGYIDDVNGWSFATNGPTPTQGIEDTHGTSVAGIAAGRGDNNLGITGAAFEAKILPVQMFDGPFYVGDALTAEAVYYAAGRTANGMGTWNAAQIINASWGGGAPSTILTNAFTYASNTARGGRGVATFISSGNEFSNSISYPANLAGTLSGVMAVGASNDRDRRSDYSNFGPELDFVTSSSDGSRGPQGLGTTTTDRTGADGYNPVDDETGDYTTNIGPTGFGGTSSASPLAAGIGALVLSVDPTLTAAEIRQILRSTADKVGGVFYNTSGFNIQYGYGRLNAYDAVLVAANTPPVANDRNFTTPEDTDLNATLTATDVDGNALTYTILTQPSNGTIVNFNPNTGAFRYRPNLNYFNLTVPDTFTFRANDGIEDSNIATVSITITPVADRPTVSPNPAGTTEDLTTSPFVITRNVVDASEVNFFKITGITGGRLFRSGSMSEVFNNDFLSLSEGAGGVIFTPNANANTPAGDLFFFLVQADTNGTGAGLSAPNLVSITATEVNDPPTAGDDPLSDIAEDSAPRTISIASLLANDSVGPANESSQTLTLIDISNIVGGTARISGSDIIFTLSPNFSGTARFNYTVQDDGTTDSVPNPRSATALVSFNVINTNDPPIISDTTDKTINEDTTLGPIIVGIGDVEAPGGGLVLTARSNNQSLIPDANIILGGSGNNRTITLTPVIDLSGSATITLTVTDPDGASAVDTFVVTVLPVNDRPTFTLAGNVMVDEDTAPNIFPNFATNFQPGPATAIDEAGQALVSYKVTVPSTTGGLTFSEAPAIAPNGTLTFSPTANLSGTATVLVTATDDGGGTTATSFTVQFTITVNAVNDNPVIGTIADQTINEDASTQTLVFSVSDLESLASTLTLSGTSSNTAVVPNANIVFGGSGGTRTVIVTPQANAFGTSTITVRVTDPDGGSAVETFVVTVLPVNDNPTISEIADQTIDEDTATNALAFTLFDPETPATALTVNATSSNQALVPNANITISGSGATRLITVTPLPDAFGTTIITLGVSDGDGGSGVETFTVTVNSVNDLPIITPIADQVINEDDILGPLSFTISDGETPAGSLILTATSSNTRLVPNGNITISGTGTARTITVRPAANLSGSTVVTLTLTDGDFSTVTETFEVVVNDLNDLPQISAVADQTISEDGTTGLLTFTISDVETPVDSLTVSVSSSNTALVPQSNVVLGGSGRNRTVSVTPLANAFGSTTITLTVTEPGGVSGSAAFTVNVTSVNEAPVAVNDVFSVTGPTVFNVLGNDSSGPDIGETLTIIAVTQGSAGGAVSIGNGAIAYAPVIGFTGAETFTYTISDGGLTSTATVSVQATFVPPPVAPAIIVIGSDVGGRVRVLEGATRNLLRDFAPYGGYGGSVRVGAGDVTGDGVSDYVTVTGTGVGHVKVFDGRTGAEVGSYMPFGSFPGGLQLAVGDLDGDGQADIVVGTDVITTHVKAISGRTGAELLSFIAFEGFGGGVRLGIGDIDGDRIADLAVVAGPGGNGHIKAFSGRTRAQLASFIGYQGFFGEINLSVADLGVGRGLIVSTAVNADAGIHVKAVGADGAERTSYFSSLGTVNGVVRPPGVSSIGRVSAGDLDGDGFDELLFINGAAALPTQVMMQDGETLSVLDLIFAFGAQYNLGGTVAAG